MSINEIAPWLNPPSGWMESAVNAGTNLGSQLGQSFMQGAQLRQRGQEMEQRQTEFNAELPLREAEAEARLTYQKSQAASQFVKIKEMEDEAADAPKFQLALRDLNEVSKTGGADAILSFKPPTFALPDTYAKFTDLQLKLASGLRNTAEAKNYAMLTNVEKARIEDIRRNGVLSNEQRAIAIDEVFSGAQERARTVKRPFTTTQSDIEALREAEGSGDNDAAQALRRKLYGDTSGGSRKMNDFDKKRHDRWNQELKSVNDTLAKIRSGDRDAGSEAVYLSRQKGLVENISELESKYQSQAENNSKKEFTTGDQVQQDGVIYEYDGKNWNPQ